MIFKKQTEGIFKWTSFKLRLFNEVATVFLVGVVFLVTVKSTGSLVWGLLGMIIFAAVMMAFVTIYRNMREKNEETEGVEGTKGTEEKKGL